MACPYFFPTEKSSELSWAFPQRLPLAAGFRGWCMANGAKSEPGERELKEFCNLGYARQCERMPALRQGDAVRFSVLGNQGIGNQGKGEVVLRYAIERDHAPVEHGQLRFDGATRACLVSHPDARIQRQAECYLAARLE